MHDKSSVTVFHCNVTVLYFYLIYYNMVFIKTLDSYKIEVN